MSATFDPLQAGLHSLRQSVDPFGIATSLWEVQRAWLQSPGALAEQLQTLGSEIWSVQMCACQRLCGVDLGDPFPARQRDERFQEGAWTENACLDVIKEFYLLYTRWLEDAIFATPDVPEKTRKRAAYWVRQGLNAMAPSNFFWTNPHAVQRFMETGGSSLLDGVRLWLDDGARGDVKMVDEDDFEVGVNLAMTPGKVVFRNRLVELI